MGVDTSIYANLLRTPKSVAEYDAEAMQGKQNKLALMLTQQKYDENQRGIERTNGLNSLLGSFKPDMSTEEQVGALTRGGHIDEGRKLAESHAKVNKDKRETEKAELEGHMKKFELAGQIMGPVKDQATWEMAKQQTAQVFGAEAAAQMPDQYNPQLVEQKRMQAMAVKEQVAARHQELTRDLSERKFTYDQTNDAANRNVTIQGQRMTDSRVRAGQAQSDRHHKESLGDTGALGAPGASEAMIDAIGTGKMSPPTGYALRNPKILAIMERVAQKYPEYDSTEYEGKKQAMRNFATGKQGDSVRSFAVASEHLKQLDGLVDALENRDVPLVNRYANKLAQQTGSAAPTNFDAAKGIVAKEVMKSIVAGGGGVEERQELSHLLDNAKTTKQLKGVIGTYLHLMEAQKEGLERQYELSTGRKDAKTRFKYTADEAVSRVTPNGGPTKVTTAADYAKIPSGAEFVTPDGKTRRKP